MTPDDPSDAVHRPLVAQLTHELAPVRPPRSPWSRVAWWVALALITVALAGVVGLRHDLRLELERPRYLLTLAILLSGAGLAATAALLAAIPGRISTREAAVSHHRWRSRRRIPG